MRIVALNLFTCWLKNTGDIKTDSIDSPQLLTDHQSNSNLEKEESNVNRLEAGKLNYILSSNFAEEEFLSREQLSSEEN